MKMIPHLVLLIAVPLITPSLVLAEVPAFEWVRSMGGTSIDRGSAAAVDSMNNAYVTGYFQGSATFGITTLSAPGQNVFVVKLSNRGDVVWATSPSVSSGGALGFGVAVDSAGAIYVTGLLYGTVAFGTTTLSAAGYNMFVAKYNSSGAVLWAKQGGSALSSCQGESVTVDSDGNPHVTGFFSGSADFEAQTLSSAGSEDIFHVKYTPSGEVIWARKAGGLSSEWAYGLAADSRGNTYVVGYFRSILANFGGIALTNAGSDSADIFLTKYDSEGNVIWATKAGGSGPAYGDRETARAIAVDAAHNVYVAGCFAGTANFGSTNVTAAGNNDAFLAKYDASGDFLWVRRVGSASLSGECAFGLTVDADGNSYLAGNFFSTASFGSTNLTSSGGSDGFLASFDANGNLLWAKKAGFIFEDSGQALALDTMGQVFFAGYYYDTANFDSTNVVGRGVDDIFVAKLLASSDPPLPAFVDNFSARHIVSGYTNYIRGVNSTYTKEPGEPQHADRKGARSAWLSWIAPDAGTCVMDTFGSAFDTVLAVYTGDSVSNLTLIASNDDAPETVQSRVSFVVTEGTIYQIAIDGYGTNDAGPFVFRMDFATSVVRYSLALLTNGSGTVIANPDRPFYDLGEQVTLTAIAGRWHNFNRWSDGSSANPRTITIGPSNNYTAIFNPTTALETVTFDGISRTAPVGMPIIFVNGEFVTEPTNTSAGRVEISMQTTFPNGTLLFTLDGSPATIYSSLYTGPFTLSHSTVVRAIAFNSDFTRSVDSDPLAVTIIPLYTLSARTKGGGAITVEPLAAGYPSNAVVSLTAVPAAGWTFMGWLGDVTGTNATAALDMTRNRCVEAVFGSSLSATATVGGTVGVLSAVSMYPYGTTVRLYGQPLSGNSFVLWANSASGTNNPLHYTVTNANAAITAVFQPLPQGQHAFAAVPLGYGTISVTPAGNRFTQGQTVTLRAIPDQGQYFRGWAGDASGTENPLSVSMTQSRVIFATFTRLPSLQIWQCPGTTMPADVLTIHVASELGPTYLIEKSSDLIEWAQAAIVTNTLGVIQWTAPVTPTRAFFRALRAP